MREFRGNLNNDGLASFNQRLFDSQACFNDVVWILDLETETAEILWDTIEPSTVGGRFSLAELRARIKSRYPGENKVIVNRYDPDCLRALKETVFFNNPTFVNKGRRFKLRQSMTPEFNERGETVRVYVTAINIRNFIPDKTNHTEIYKTVSMILSHGKNHEESIRETLAYLGDALNVSRVYIMENDPDDPTRGSNTFEWCADGVAPNRDALQHVSYKEYGFDAVFADAQLYCCPNVASIEDPFMRKLFEDQGIRAFINYAFYDNDRFAGFIGIDDNRFPRVEWDSHSEEIETLTFVADLLMTYLIKERNLIRYRASAAEAKAETARSAEFLGMLETLAGSAPWYVYYNEDGTEGEVNWGQSLRDMLGYEGEHDFPNTFSSWVNSIHPGEREIVPRDCEEQLKKRGYYNRTYRAVKKDGTVIWMKTQGTTKYYPDGAPRLYYGTIHDVTEEETLRQKEQENKALMQHFINAYTSAYTVNLKERSFEILHMAHEFRQVFTMGGRLADMARFVEEHVHPDDRPMARRMTDPDYVRERLKTEDTVTFTLREQYHDQERVMHVIIMRSIDADHCAIGFMDVTKELQKEKELNEKLEAANVAMRSDREKTRLIEALSDSFSSVYAVDVASFEYRRVVEREPSALVFPEAGRYDLQFDRYVDRFMQPEYRDAFRAMLNREYVVRALAGRNRLIMEYCREDGSWRRGYFLPVDYDESGRLKSFLFAVQNIAEAKQEELRMQRALKEAYEAAQLASNAKTTFLANMSHDIRTPMNAIIGMTAIAGSHLDDPDRIADCLKKINSSGRHLLGLINQVLDMSKIESGKVDLSEEDFNLSELMDEVISMNHAAGRARGHRLNVRVENLFHKHVTGDRTRLEQVFNNLLSNAIKYTPDGGKIDVILSEKQTNKDNIGWYEVIFRDNGIGMTEEFRKTIFDPFSRATDRRAASKQGTGLGMPIARNIVRMMNGDIKVESELDRGSTFTVSFALKIDESRNPGAPDLPENPAPAEEDDIPDFTGRRILLAEDNELNREIALELLGAYGLTIDTAPDGSLCADRFIASAPGTYDLIFMDIQMPVMNGYDAARAIRASDHPDGQTVPIIAMTANAFSTDVRSAFEAGMNGHISKPIDMTTVLKTLKEWLK